LLTGLVGERAFTLGYSLLSVAALALLIFAAGRAPYVELWPPAPWQSWAPNLAMPVVCLLLAFGMAVPNPLSFGGTRPERFNPDQPGIVGVARHPLLLALALWAGTHVLPNGDIAHLVLFGLFASFALAGMATVDRRKRRLMGEAERTRLAARTSLWPLSAVLQVRGVGPGFERSQSRLLIAMALYGALLALHSPVIGLAPWPS
jgi:uncharacterized membrane protein